MRNQMGVEQFRAALIALNSPDKGTRDLAHLLMRQATEKLLEESQEKERLKSCLRR